jgi:hypothetical protein
MAASSFLGLAWALRRGAHIRVALLIEKLAPPKRRVAELACLALGTALAGYFAWYALDMVIDGIRFPEYTIGLIPIPGDQPASLSMFLGFGFAPIAFIMGVPWDDCSVVGGLIATKTVVNEFVAYQQLAAMMQGQSTLQLHHPLSMLIATYALCGFANFSSIGIQIGGIAAMCPERRGDVARLGLKAMICGALATFQTATIAACRALLGECFGVAPPFRGRALGVQPRIAIEARAAGFQRVDTIEPGVDALAAALESR